MSATVAPADLKHFVRAFHDIYPHALSRSQKKEIWRIARQLFDGDISIAQAIAATGISQEDVEGDLAKADGAIGAVLALICVLIVMFAYHTGGRDYAGAATAPSSKEPTKKEQLWRDLFSELERGEDLEEWRPTHGEPVPVLEPRRKPQTSTPRPKRSRVPARSEIGAVAKRSRRGRAKRLES